MNIQSKLTELGLTLPELPPAGGIYKPVLVVGDIAYVSGQVPSIAGVPQYTGKLGEVDVETGQEAAKLCALNALSVLADHLGSLDKIERVVKTLGFVASTPDFFEQPQVINGCSALLRDIFGEDKGIAARSAVGLSALPGNVPVEIEFQFQVKVDG